MSENLQTFTNGELISDTLMLCSGVSCVLFHLWVLAGTSDKIRKQLAPFYLIDNGKWTIDN